MAGAERRRLPAAARRALIEAAAARLFAERGYAATRLDDVAAAANVTKPVLYRHFETKKALYLALLERHRAQLPRFVQPRAPAAPPRRSGSPRACPPSSTVGSPMSRRGRRPGR